MLAFYPEGNTVLASDNELRSLHKIADGSSGGSGPGGAQQVYTGAAPPAAPDNPALPALFYPTGGGTLFQWDGAAWV